MLFRLHIRVVFRLSPFRRRRTASGMSSRRLFQLAHITKRWCLEACCAHSVSFCVASSAAAKSILMVNKSRRGVAVAWASTALSTAAVSAMSFWRSGMESGLVAAMHRARWSCAEICACVRAWHGATVFGTTPCSSLQNDCNSRQTICSR